MGRRAGFIAKLLAIFLIACAAHAEYPESDFIAAKQPVPKLATESVTVAVPNGHGNIAAPDNKIRHARFPLPMNLTPSPQPSPARGEGAESLGALGYKGAQTDLARFKGTIRSKSLRQGTPPQAVEGVSNRCATFTITTTYSDLWSDNY